MDNTQDPSLQSIDNPFFLKRFGNKFQLTIDGQQYKENTYEHKKGGTIYSGFGSWRKWIGYEDLVAE